MDRLPSRFPGGRTLAIAILAIVCFAIGPSVARASPLDSDAHTRGGKAWRAALSADSLAKPANLSGPWTASQTESPALPAEGDSPETPAGPDLSIVRLDLADMPAGFELLPESQTASMKSMADGFLSGAGMHTQAETINLVAFRSSDPIKVEIVWSFLLTPLSRAEQLGFDRGVANPTALFQALNQALLIGEFGTPEVLQDVGTLGNRSIAFALPMTSLGVSLRLEAVIARRGEVVEEVWVMYREGEQSQADVGALARLLDERLATVLGPTANTFRPAGPLVPELTTYIPTPLDVSTEPGVVGTNLLLAALVMLPFAAATEVFTHTLAENEGIIKQRFRPLTWIVNLQAGLSKFAGPRLGDRGALLDVTRLLVVVLFYGLVFSFLDRTWNPFSLTGLVLLFNMTVAYGLVGIADDLLQWRALRRWGLPGEIGLRLSNVFIAIASTATSRLLVLAPGLMFGTPEALQIDEEQLDQDKQGRLLKISAFTLLALGFGLWLPTLLTSLLQSLPLPASVLNLIAGLEGLLLVVFAVALENTFVQMLGLPGGFGQALKQRHHWLWLGGLILITFLFYHTLLNPRGDLAQGLQVGSVRLFLAATSTFVIITFGLWLFSRGRKRAIPGDQDVQVAVDRLIYTLREVPPEGQAAAVQDMISLGQPAVGPLITYLEHPDHWARLMAAAALGKMHDASAILPLGKMLEDQDQGVRYMAGVALSALRKEFPAEPEAVQEEPHAWPPTTPGVEEPAVTPLVPPDDAAAGVSPPPMEIAQPAIVAEAIQRVAVSKTCPNCGMEIKAEALVCRHCQTKFAIQAKGYCLSCHAVVLAVDGCRCAQCGGELVDPHIVSRWLSEPPVSHPAPVQTVPSTSLPQRPVASPTSRKLPNWLWLALGAIMIGTVIWLVRSNLTQPEPESQPVIVAQVSSATPSWTPSPSRTPTPTATRTPRPPTPTPIPEWIKEFAEPILTAVSNQPPAFEADFSTGAGRVVVWRCEVPQCVIADGVMLVSVDNANINLGGYLQGRDFLLQFEALPITVSPNASISVFFRHVQGSQTRISFDVYVAQGRWIFHRDLADSTEIFAEGPDTAIQPGEALTIRILARGDQTAVYLNSAPLTYATDTLADGDWIFFNVDSPSGQASVQFDNVKFWNLDNIPSLP